MRRCSLRQFNFFPNCVSSENFGLFSFFRLVSNWEDQTITDTWTSEEKGLMIFCIIMFLLLFIWVTFSLMMRVRAGISKFPRPELALISLMILSACTSFMKGKFTILTKGSGSSLSNWILRGSLRRNQLESFILRLTPTLPLNLHRHHKCVAFLKIGSRT